MVLARSSMVSLALCLAACGGGGGGSPSTTTGSPVGMWAGVLHGIGGDGVMHLALLDDGTVSMRTGGPGEWTTYSGTYTETDGAVSATVVHPPSVNLILTAELDGTHLTGGVRVPPSGTTSSTYELELDTSSAVGIWKGSYSGSLPFLFLAFPDGDLEVHDGADLEAPVQMGTWEQAAGTFSAIYADDGLALAATLSDDTLTGTWGTPPAATSGGPFTVTRER